MARRPRNVGTQSVVTDKQILLDDTHNQRMKMRIEVDSKPVTVWKRNVNPNDDRQEILDDTADQVLKTRNENVGRRGADEARKGNTGWKDLPNDDDKKRIAQRAMRDVVEFAREGKELQEKGETRPEAFERYAQTRSLKANIWDELDFVGNNVDKAAYLALSGPGPGTEYGELNSYMNDLGNAAADWNAVVTFMRNCNNPIPIETEMTV